MKKFLLFFVLCSTVLACRSDINGDGRVDFQDLTILTEEWGCEEMTDSYLKFNGVDQYVTVANNAALNFGTGEFSISFWCKDVFTGYGTILSKGNGFGIPGYSAYYNSGTLYLTTGTTLSGASLGFDIPLNTKGWIFVVMTRVGITGVIYVNGSNSGVYGQTLDGNLDTTADFFIGSYDLGVDLLTGSLDDIRIYKGKALSQAEINTIYDEGRGKKLTGTETSLSWGSNCDDATGNTLTDITGTVNGTLTGNVADNMWASGGVPFALESDTVTAFDSNERWGF